MGKIRDDNSIRIDTTPCRPSQEYFLRCAYYLGTITFQDYLILRMNKFVPLLAFQVQLWQLSHLTTLHNACEDDDVNNLHDKIKEMIVRRLKLRINPAEILNTAPLFIAEDGGLGLDSIDALDLAVGLFEEFQVEVTPADMDIFENVDSMASFVEKCLSPVAVLTT